MWSPADGALVDMSESQGGSVPAKLPEMMLVCGLGDGIRELDIVRVRWIVYRQLYCVGLLRDQQRSQEVARGPPSTFLPVVTSILGNFRGPRLSAWFRAQLFDSARVVLYCNRYSAIEVSLLI